jgi:hypothetical protein
VRARPCGGIRAGGQPTSTATRVPETHELEGDDALNALRRTGWGRLAKDSFQRFRTADGFTNDLHDPDRGGPG